MSIDQSEETLFEAFTVPSKRRRYGELLATKRGLDKIRFALDRFYNLDPRFCKKVAASEQNAAGVLKLLKEFGAPPVCYVLSSLSELDRREMDLADALTAVSVRGFGAFVCYLPGKLACFEGEAPNAPDIFR